LDFVEGKFSDIGQSHKHYFGELIPKWKEKQLADLREIKAR